MGNKSSQVLLEDLIEEFKDCLREGKNPSIEEFAQNNPEHSETIQDIFPTIQSLEALKGEKEGLNAARTPLVMKLSHLGEYQIIREIGRGGMGIVYEAIQKSLDRRVAVKTLPWLDQAGDVTLKRFKQEARIAANLEYPNIVSILDMDVDEGIHYYAMRYIDGFGLDTLISHLCEYGLVRNSEIQSYDNSLNSSGGQSTFLLELISQIQNPDPIKPKGSQSSSARDPLEQVYSSLPAAYYNSIARLIAQVANALHYAHCQGALHRDIKPANLLLDQLGLIWITDFGLAKSVSSETLTRTQDMLGTLRYMAPERFEGQDDDARSDIYSLGLTLYELLTLQPAYSGQSGNLMYRILKGDATSPRLLNRYIPASLEAIITKATMLEPSRRYQSCQEMEKALLDFVQQQNGQQSQSQSSQGEGSRPPPPLKTTGKKLNQSRKSWPAQAAYPLLILLVLILGYLFVTSEEEEPTPVNLQDAAQVTNNQQQRQNERRPERSSRALPPQNNPPQANHSPAEIRPPQPKEPAERIEVGATGQEQYARVAEILSRYDATSLNAQDAKEINRAFREAGIRRGKGQTEAVSAAGFSPETLRRLDPPPNAPR